MNFIIYSVQVFVLLLVIQCSANDLERGLGAEIDWLPLDEGLQAAKAENKMLMLIVHKSWCGACKAFKPKFAASKEIRELSKNFVMVNVFDDDEPSDPKYSPDGKYIPRILFIEPSNESVKLDIFNKNGNPSYKYYYSDAESVILSMKVALIVGDDEKNEL